MSGGVLVVNPSQDGLQVALNVAFDEISNVTNASTKKNFLVGQTFVEIAYLQGTGSAATGKFLYAVFNSLNDATAPIELSKVGLRIPIPLGESRVFVFPATAPCRRIDLVTDAAETGSTKTILTTGA